MLIVIAKIEVFHVQYIKQVYQTNVVSSCVVLLLMILCQLIDGCLCNDDILGSIMH